MVVVNRWILEWWEWLQKTLKVLGILLVLIVVAVRVFGVVIEIPVSYEMVNEVIKAEISDATGEAPKHLAKK